jgi:predicted nucleic acid-binding protein
MMTSRVQVLLDMEERERLRRCAQAEGLSLSAWFRRAALERAEAHDARGRIKSPEALSAFFAACDARECGREPEWEDHLKVIAASRATNVIMFAVGRPHPLRAEARAFFEDSMKGGTSGLCTSAEVLQELLHAYLPVGRIETLDAALTLAEGCVKTVWAVEEADVRLARTLVGPYSHLSARDLLHVAMCRRRGVSDVKTYDRALAAAFGVGT